MSDVPDKDSSQLRCLRCKGWLEPSGREPYRFICPDCGQHFMAVMQLVPVDSVDRREAPQLESSVAEGSPRTD